MPVAANSLRSQHASKLVRSFESIGHVCDGIATVHNMGVAGKDAFADSESIFKRSRPLPKCILFPSFMVVKQILPDRNAPFSANLARINHYML